MYTDGFKLPSAFPVLRFPSDSSLKTPPDDDICRNFLEQLRHGRLEFYTQLNFVVF